MSTAKPNPELTAAAIDGFNGVAYDPQKHGMRTSDKHAAFIVGQRIKFLAGDLPHGVRKGRGDRVHANGHLWHVNWKASPTVDLITA